MTAHRPHRRARRVAVALAAGMVLLSACSSGEDVPQDQQLQPAEVPSGWVSADLDVLTIAAPPAWTQDDTTSLEEGTESTAWRTPMVDGRADGGMEVRVITEPDHDAATAAKALGVNAMATMQAGKPAPRKIVWPNATEAWLLDLEATYGTTPEESEQYVNTILVADLADGRQVQVLVLNRKGLDDDLPLQVLSTVRLSETSA